MLDSIELVSSHNDVYNLFRSRIFSPSGNFDAFGSNTKISMHLNFFSAVGMVKRIDDFVMIDQFISSCLLQEVNANSL